MEVYWDRAFVAATRGASPVTVTTLHPRAADLHYRGFSRMYRKGGRYGPQWYAYDEVSREPAWAPIAGAFTRYGDVLPLLDAPDDRYVIFGPGDETALQFDATPAPTLPPGWTRDFVLYTDAWMKDADLNTASGGTVGPLPFHGMSRYPGAMRRTRRMRCTGNSSRRITRDWRLGTRASGLGAHTPPPNPESRVPRSGIPV